MAKTNFNRTCVVCKQNYSFCNNNCAEDRDKPTWMTVFHDDNCRKIYYTCANYEVGHIGTKNQAKKELKKLDTTNYENYNPVIKEWIDDIMGVERNDYATDEVEDTVG